MANVIVEIKNKDIITELQLPYGQIYFGGYVLYKGNHYHKDNISTLFEAENFLMENLTELNGEFVCIYKGASKAIAIADRKRSIPLFYYQEGEVWKISDKLSHSDSPLNRTAVKEFITTGFTANEKTLYQNVFQVEAGSYVQFESDSQPVIKEYYQYYHQPVESDLEQLSKELEEVMLQSFQDLAVRLKNKVPMLPLSGGYDSRIVALLLKEMGIENISSFTYGKTGNRESHVSKQIAQKLGLQWDFIEYNKSDWYKWYSSPQWQEYVDFSVNGTAMAHLQDWPAVTKVVEGKDEPYVFIPGHSGDFLAGSHLAYEITVDRTFKQDEVIQFILAKHHKLWEMDKGFERSGKDLIEEIRRSIKDLNFQTNEQASAAFEYWDWKERQAKFIINSVRVYEFYGYGWEIPLWDDRMMEFFKKVPVEYRFKQYLYDYTLHRMYPSYFPEPVKVSGKESSLKEKYGPFYKTAKKLYNKKRIYQQYHKDPMQWYGIYKNYYSYLRELSFKFDHINYKNPYNINSFLAKDYIRNLKGEIK